jgi:hypothetical protein
MPVRKMKVLSLMLLSGVTTIADAQIQRHPPAISCDLGDGNQACTSLKQLVNARDAGILLNLMGDTEEAGRHVAYACFSSDVDNFYIVQYSAPEQQSFTSPFTPPDSKMRQRFFFGPLLELDQVPTTMIDLWFADHSKTMVFADGVINLFTYRNGFLTGMNSAFGEWTRPKDSPVGVSPNSVGYSEFTGNIYWLNHVASARPMVSLTSEMMMAESFANSSELYMHYRFAAKDKSLGDDTLQIQRSTGRFIETIKVSGREYDDHGACKVFKY